MVQLTKPYTKFPSVCFYQFHYTKSSFVYLELYLLIPKTETVKDFSSFPILIFMKHYLEGWD